MIALTTEQIVTDMMVRKRLLHISPFQLGKPWYLRADEEMAELRATGLVFPIKIGGAACPTQ